MVPEHPFSLIIFVFLGVIAFFAITCKFGNAWCPKQSNFNNSLFKLHFAWENVLQQFFLCVSLHVFALRTKKLDVLEEAIAKLAFLFLHCFEFVNYQCNFDTGIAFFTLLRKTVFCSVKIAMLWLFFGCILEQCNVYTRIVKRRVQKCHHKAAQLQKTRHRAKPRAQRHSSTAADTPTHAPHPT